MWDFSVPSCSGIPSWESFASLRLLASCLCLRRFFSRFDSFDLASDSCPLAVVLPSMCFSHSSAKLSEVILSSFDFAELRFRFLADPEAKESVLANFCVFGAVPEIDQPGTANIVGLTYIQPVD